MTTDVLPNQIVPIILINMKDHLTDVLMSSVPEDSPTRAVVVKVGRFQDNPLQKNVSLAISGGDFEDSASVDGRIDNPSVKPYPYVNLPVGEIGGGAYWYRKGSVNFQAYFVRERFDEETAMNYAYEFYGRLIAAIADTPITPNVDDFGEYAYPPIIVEGNTLFESGGKDKFIWRGKVLWRILTWRPEGV